MQHKSGKYEHDIIKRVEFDRMAKKYLFIIAKCDEIMGLFDNVFMFSSNMRNIGGGERERRLIGSGFCVLLFALVQELDTNNKWTDDNVIALKQCKTNICKGKTSHFNSKGYYASFGNKANYAIIDNSSISQYSTKKSSNKLKQVLVNDSAHLFEYLSASEIDRSIISFARYLRKIPELLSPVVNEAFNSQNQWGNINLKLVATSKSGL